MLLSEIVNKRVIVLNDAIELGCVEGAYVHMHNLEHPYLLLSDGKIVNVDELFSIGEVITVLNYTPQTLNLDEYLKINVNQEVILVSGNSQGKVVDLALKGNKLKGYLATEKGKIKLKCIVSSSPNLIVANPTYRILKNRVKEPKNAILGVSGVLAPSGKETVDIPLLQQSNTPSYDFLIGKKVKSEVSDINHSFVLMAGTIITEKIISNAIRAGKLTDLVNKSR